MGDESILSVILMTIKRTRRTRLKTSRVNRPLQGITEIYLGIHIVNLAGQIENCHEMLTSAKYLLF